MPQFLLVSFPFFVIMAACDAKIPLIVQRRGARATGYGPKELRLRPKRITKTARAYCKCGPNGKWRAIILGLICYLDDAFFVILHIVNTNFAKTMPMFELISDYQPSGDQPQAIEQLTRGVLAGERAQTLLGVTGSGKTFTIANVIRNVARPTLVLSHNKALAAQLYQEFKTFFPRNAVEYYVSYYDYYQPEAYIASTETYIEKDLAINQDIDKLRLAATSALLSGRRDIIVVASISCIYGMGNPAAFYENLVELKQGMRMDRNHLLRRFIHNIISSFK